MKTSLIFPAMLAFLAASASSMSAADKAPAKTDAPAAKTADAAPATVTFGKPYTATGLLKTRAVMVDDEPTTVYVLTLDAPVQATTADDPDAPEVPEEPIKEVIVTCPEELDATLKAAKGKRVRLSYVLASASPPVLHSVDFYASKVEVLKDKSAAPAAAEAEDIGAIAETFLAGYIKTMEANEDVVAWVAASELATESFKAAYKKAVSVPDIESDPVLHAQDVPTGAFKAEKVTVKAKTAAVPVTAKFGDTPHKLVVSLVEEKGQWLISKIDPAGK